MSYCPVTGKIIASKLKIDTHELAWAAGFFDGEGCSYCHLYKNNPHRNPTLNVSVSQKTKPKLIRFQNAVLGLGQIYHTKYGMYQFMSHRFEDTQAIIGMIWKYLEEEKRKQYVDARITYIAGYKGNFRNGFKVGFHRKSYTKADYITSSPALSNAVMDVISMGESPTGG